MENKKGEKPEKLRKALDSVSGQVKNEPKLKHLQADKQMLTYEQLLENPAKISCRNGSIFGMNTSPQKHANEKCRKYSKCHSIGRFLDNSLKIQLSVKICDQRHLLLENYETF